MVMIWPVGDELGQAAAGHHQDQRGDDRLDAEAGDQEAVPQRRAAGDSRRAMTQADHERRRARSGRRCRRSGQATAPAMATTAPTDRSMPPGGDDQRHAQRDQHERRAVAQDVDQAAVEVAVVHARCRRSRRRRRRWPAAAATSASDRPEQPVAGALAAARPARAPRSAGCAPLAMICMTVASRRSSSLAQLGDLAAVAQHDERWLSRSTSSSSAEMNTHRHARPSARSATSRWISALAPTSMPRVGSSRISSRGSVISQRASSTFCWLPPREVAHARSGSAGRMSQRLDVLVDQLVLARARDRPDPAARGLQREHDVLPHGQVADEPLGPCGSRSRRRCVRPMACARGAQPTRGPSTVICAGVGAVGAEQQPGELGAAGAEQPGEPDDLALVEVEVERRDRALAAEADRLQRPARSASVGGRALGARCRARSSDVELACRSSARPARAAAASAVGYSPTSAPLRSTVMRSEIS